VSYLFTGLAGCSVDPGNSRGARKLTRTPQVIKKKKIGVKNILGPFKPRLISKPFEMITLLVTCYEMEKTC
jgi:hypothetical protein